MKTMRGVKPAKVGHGSGWQIVISDPFQKRQRRFNFDSQTQALTKKLDIRTKVKAIQQGSFTVPPRVTDIVLWLAKGGSNGCSEDAVEPAETALIREAIDAFLITQRALWRCLVTMGFLLAGIKTTNFNFVGSGSCEDKGVKTVREALSALESGTVQGSCCSE